VSGLAGGAALPASRLPTTALRRWLVLDRDKGGGEKECARVSGSRPGDRFDASRNALHRQSQMNDHRCLGPDSAQVGEVFFSPGLGRDLLRSRGPSRARFGQIG
jgi:hypothetical protein